MEETVKKDQQLVESVNIRILSDQKKSSFRTARVKGFPVVETCDEFRQKVSNLLPGERLKDGFSFGFVEKKQKIWILTDAQLSDAYAAAVNGPHLWIDPSSSGDSSATVEPQTRKRPYEAENDHTKNSDVQTKKEKIESRIEKLESDHGTKYQPYQFRLWAEMLVLGSHKIEDVPPSLPIFTGSVKAAKRPCTSTSTPLASAVPSSHQNQQQGAGSSRTELLQQIKILHELKSLGALTEEEFLSKKKLILDDMN